MGRYSSAKRKPAGRELAPSPLLVRIAPVPTASLCGPVVRKRTTARRGKDCSRRQQAAGTLRISASGQSRRFHPLPATSGLPQTTDIIRPARLFRLVPSPDSCAAAKGRLFHHLVGAGEPAFIRVTPLSEGPQSAASSSIARPEQSTRI